MRAACLLLLLAMLLSACSATTAPTGDDTPAPATTPTKGYATAAPTGGPAENPPASATPVPLSGLPAYLRTLDFRVPAGNSYNPQPLAFHPGLNRLYARTRGRLPGAILPPSPR